MLSTELIILNYPDYQTVRFHRRALLLLSTGSVVKEHGSFSKEVCEVNVKKEVKRLRRATSFPLY